MTDLSLLTINLTPGRMHCCFATDIVAFTMRISELVRPFPLSEVCITWICELSRAISACSSLLRNCSAPICTCCARICSCCSRICSFLVANLPQLFLNRVQHRPEDGIVVHQQITFIILGDHLGQHSLYFLCHHPN